MNLKLLFATLVATLTTPYTFGQEIITQGVFTAKYENQNITLTWDKNEPITVTHVRDASTQEVIPIRVTAQEAILNVTHPGQIIAVTYLDSDQTKTTFLASKSLSTGTINVYFNHPVDTSVAQTQNAVNLGNTLDDKLIQLINACVSTLDIAIYNSYSPSGSTGIAGAINAAYARGVNVRVIYDSSTSSIMIGLLNPAIPTLASPSGTPYGIMHNKFVIFDANNSNANIPLVWTGSTNWTTAQIDGPDTNSVITIQDQALALGYKLEFEEMWGSTTMTPNAVNAKFGPFKTDNTPHSYIIGGKTVENYFSPSDGVNAKILNTINSANSDMEIATMIVTRTDLANAISTKFTGGVSNTFLLVDSQNPLGNQFPNLQTTLGTSRAVSYAPGAIMHHKFIVVDNNNHASDTQVLLGSHNWTSSAETKNDENTLIVHDANIANQYYQAFSYLFQLSSGTLNTFDSNTLETFNLYPNPTHDYINIQNSNLNAQKITNVRFFDLTGKVISQQSISDYATQKIDVSNFQSGLYILEIQTEVGHKEFKFWKE